MLLAEFSNIVIKHSELSLRFQAKEFKISIAHGALDHENVCSFRGTWGKTHLLGLPDNREVPRCDPEGDRA